MKKAKVVRVIALALVVLLLALTAGCGGGGGQQAEEKIKIAVLGPMAFMHGQHQWNGAEIAAAEINANGGIKVGETMKKVELVKADTNELLNVSEAATAMERAITVDKADFLVGGFRSEAVLAMQDVAMDSKKVYLSVGSISPQLSDKVKTDYARYKYYFRAHPMQAADIVKASFLLLNEVAGVVREDLKLEKPKVALLIENVLAFEPIAQAAPKAIPTMGMEVVGIWRPSQTATDTTAELTAIKESGAQIIFTMVSGPVGIVFAKQWEEMKVPAVSIGINVEAQSGNFMKSTNGKGNYESTLTFKAKTNITEKTIPFIEKYQKDYGEMPSYLASTYDAVFMLKEAIERAGSIEADQVVAELEKTQMVGASGKYVFDEKHDPKWGPGLLTGIGVQWVDGEQKVFWPNNWQGVTYAGTQRYVIPPWVKEHWVKQ